MCVLQFKIEIQCIILGQIQLVLKRKTTKIKHKFMSLWITICCKSGLTTTATNIIFLCLRSAYTPFLYVLLDRIWKHLNWTRCPLFVSKSILLFLFRLSSVLPRVKQEHFLSKIHVNTRKLFFYWMNSNNKTTELYLFQ